MKQKWWNNNYTVLMITWMGWISIYLALSVLPPLLPVITTELGLSYTQAGLLETAYLIGYIISKLPAGAMSDRYGARKVLAMGMIGYGFSTLLITYAQGFSQIFTLRFLVGLFQGVHLPVSNALLSDRFKDKQSRAIGFNESGPNIGNTLAYPVAISILSRWGWRTAFTILSLPAFLLSIATLLLVHEEPIFYVGGIEEENRSLRDYTWVLVPYALAHAAYNLVLRATFTFTPIFLVEYKGLDVAAAGFMAMVLPFAGIFAKLSSGLIVERTSAKNAICGAAALSAVFLATLVIFPGTSFLALNLLVLGLTLYCFSPIIYSSTTSGLPSGLKALGLGVVTMFGNIVGAVSTSVVGALIDARGYSFTFQAISFTTILVCTLIFFIMSSHKFKKNKGSNLRAYSLLIGFS